MRAAITNALSKNLPADNVDICNTNLKGFVFRMRRCGSYVICRVWAW